MFDNLKEDYCRYKGKKGNLAAFCIKAILNAGFRAVMLYRIGFWLRKHRCRLVATIIERVMHHLCHCWISTSAEIGPGFLIAHVGSLVIGQGTRIGKNCDVRQNVTFGGNFNKKNEQGRTQPWVDDNVSFGAGAVVIGPIKVGSNSIIGANSVVTRDVPENVIVFGVPATVIKEKWDGNSGRGL
jgi:serine O-acetyltransferase